MDVMRSQYRPLTDTEKEQMQHLKEMGEELHRYIKAIGTSRELSLAATKVEEGVMWATKHITGPKEQG